MTKSPVALVKEAFRAAQASLPTYSSHYSRKDFTQHQLFSILALRIFFKTDYPSPNHKFHHSKNTTQNALLSQKTPQSYLLGLY